MQNVKNPNPIQELPALSDIEAHNLCEQGYKLARHRLETDITLCATLWKIKATRAYSTEYGSFSAYLDGFADIRDSVASRMAFVHQKCVVEWGVPTEYLEKLGWSASYMIAKQRNPSTPRRAVEAFREVIEAKQSGSHLRSYIKNPDCPCGDCFKVILSQCRKCGMRTRVSSTE